MKKTILTAIGVLAFASLVHAQVVIVGPNSRLSWQDLNTPVATALTLTVAVTVDAAGSPINMTPIACVADTTVVTTADCSAPLALLPMGTHSITATNTSGTLVSAPSSAFAYTTLLIPIPSGIHVIAKVGWLWNKHYRLT